METDPLVNEKLDRLLQTITKDNRHKWVETLSTILLSAATLLSSWCILQSSQWSGEQYFFIDDENIANQFMIQKEMAVAQRKTAEIQVFLFYSSAVSTGNTVLVDFLYKRFPPHLKFAFKAWKAKDPANNPLAPASPFEMKEYVLPEVAEVAMYAEKAKNAKKAANVADSHSDNYVLLSLVLSMVLFFSGLSGVTNSFLNQKILLGIASLIFATALVFIITLPVLL